MKNIFFIIVSLLAFQNIAFSQTQTDGWLWVQYPWAYSSNEKSWIAMFPAEDRLWFWHMNDGRWDLKTGTAAIGLFGRVEFASIEDLEIWATDTARGGYQLEQIEYEDRSIIILRRSFTWGALSCDLSVFVEADGGWWRRHHVDPIYGSYIEYAVEDEEIVFVATPSSANILSINLDFLTSGR